MPDPDITPDEADRQQAEKFKKGLREACERQLAYGSDYVRIFISNKDLRNDIPPECRGIRAMSFGFFHATTILKTLGLDEGLDMLLRLNHDAPEIAAAYRVVAGMPLEQSPSGGKGAAGTAVRRLLAYQCQAVVETLVKVMRLDVDPAQQHAINTLISECRWCIREVCGIKEQDDGQTEQNQETGDPHM